ncbi:MAG: protein-disulfide reductase DsbD [Alcaligenaceae bacterium]|nr:protein-disulfide reductase DsbD [Alcaligenaceae bacterium]
MNNIKHFLSLLFFALFSFFLSIASIVSVQAQEDFLPPEKAFAISTTTPSPDQLHIRFKIAPNYYMYMNHVKFHVVGDDDQGTFKQALLGEPVFGEPIVKFDETFGEEMPVFYDPMVIDVPLRAIGQPVRVVVTAQGCADAGLCYPPEEYPIDLEPTEVGYKISDSAGLLGRMLGGNKATEPTPLDFTALALNHPAADSSSAPVLTEVDEHSPVTAIEQTDSTTDSTSNSISSNTTATSPTEPTARSLSTAGDTQIADWLDESGFMKIILITFGLGLLLSLTPCVLPMLPILLALVVGQQNTAATAGAKEKSSDTRFRSLALTLAYVFGTSIVYTLLGVAAASVGAALAVWIQNPWVLSIFAAVLVLLAFAMFGSFSLQTPTGVQSKLNRLMDKLPGGRYGSALIMGMVSALIAGPCVAAPLAGVLLFISQTGDMLTGAIALFALAWGQGASLIVIGTTSGALMPKAGSWMEGVKQFCGLLLLGVALWMVQPLLPSWLSILLWAFLAFSLSVIFGAFKSMDAQGTSVFAIFAKAIAYLALIWGILLLIGLASGRPSLLKPLQGLNLAQNASTISTGAQLATSPGSATAITNADFQRIGSSAELDEVIAQNAGRPVMLDFYADWCVSCHQMEAFTFSVPEVAQKMQQMALLQADVTPNTPEDRELLKRFRLFGPPGIIFFDPNGNELKDIRVVGFQNAERFSESLDRVLAK